jgi:hypothetical protein
MPAEPGASAAAGCRSGAPAECVGQPIMYRLILRSQGVAESGPRATAAWRLRPRQERQQRGTGQALRRWAALESRLLNRMSDSGEPVPVIAETLGVSRATLYRTLAETNGEPMPRLSPI